MPGFAIDRMCAGAMTAVTTTASGIGFGAYDVVIAGGVEHMGNHPMGAGADPNPRFMSERIVDPAALNMGNTAENLHDRFPAITKDRTDAYAVASQDKLAAAYAKGQIQPDLVPVATMKPGQGWTVNTVDEPPRPGTSLGDLAALQDPVPRPRPGHGGQRRRPERRRHRSPAGLRRRRRGTRACRSGCAW